jgi:serine/threonine protein kinase
MTAPVGACTSCQTPLPSDAQFCPRCGAATPAQVSGGGVTDAARGLDPTAERQQEIQSALGSDYVVERLIGSGGFAEVWAATDTKLQRKVAVKVLHPDLVASRSLVARFQREAQSIAKLRHPGIIPIYTVGRADDLVYYVMPLVEGESLQEYLGRHGTLDPDEARRILRETAAALAVAHEAGIVHRDVKPENIMLEGRERRVLVMDFGIAKSTTAAAQTGLTGTGVVIGTPYYMSPEQALGSKGLDARSDLYSLGCVGYRMLTGRLPYEGNTAQEVISRLLTSDPAPMESLAPGLPDDLRSAVARCLAKQPDERFASAGDLLVSLTPPGAAAPPRQRLRRPRVRLRPTWVVVATLLVAAGILVVPPWLRNFPRHGPAAPTASPAWRSEQAVPSIRLSALPVSDSVLLVSTALTDSGIIYQVYDGTGWRAATTHRGGLGRPVMVRGERRFYDVQGTGWAWNGQRWQAREQLGMSGVLSVWSDGTRVEVVATNNGVFRRVGRQWLRQPMPTSSRLDALFGREVSKLYGLLSHPESGGRDSLLAYNGVSWASQPVRWDDTASTTLRDGVTLADRTTLIVGSTCRGQARCVPLVLRQRGWKQFLEPVQIVETDWIVPQVVQFTGAWGESGFDFWVWGGTGAGAEQCSQQHVCTFHITAGDGISAQVELRGRTVLRVFTLRGVPHALTDDGFVWALAAGRWGVASEVPGTAIRSLAAGPFGSAGVDDLGRVRETFGVADTLWRGRWARVVAGDSGAWGLSRDGRLLELRCARPASRSGAIESRVARCRAAEVPRLPVTSRFTDVAPLPQGGALAATVDGRMLRRDASGWVGENVPGGGPADSRPLLRSRGRWALLVGAGAAWRRDSLGRWSRLLRRPMVGVQDAAVLPSGRAVLVHRGCWLTAIVSEQRAWTANIPECDGSVVRLVSLADGRLVVGTGSPEDPLLTGRLGVLALDDVNEAVSVVWVPLPRMTDVWALAEDGHDLLVGGSAGWAARLPLDSLPRPEVARRRPLEAREDAMIAAEKNDLRRLVSAQESHWAGHQTYTGDPDALDFKPSPGVTITLLSAGNTGWSASSRHNATTAWCGIFVGAAASPVAGASEGEPLCTSR